ncbi:uncharacterized protein SPSC_01682 [Sporisorium scitamineum]|uniref:Uncharacterized protein n=1 Tax=Sporisorium scitamineum TaxID=49012 RepID=A0A0F7S4F7_9BASI|nr:uncharacterized protein SPSC_01682 [Sporisorium scitamineum]CDW97251.1 hypothetical protein [Sporisorium scitamineum]
MGACMSTKAVEAEQVNPPPHPQARRVWLVSTPVDSRDVPLDLVGIDSDGLKAAMRNRGLETEHWALKVDPQTNVKAEPSIFDITVQGGSLVSQIHSTSSPYWKGITRRVAIGWTLWTDQEIMQASKLLIRARPKYDGRHNNSQMLARLLGRHIDFVPAQSQQTEAATTTATSPSGSILKADSTAHEANNRSQMTLVSGAQSQPSQSIESDANEIKPASESNVSRVPASIRNSQRMSVARPPLIHFSTAPSAAASEMGTLVRPPLQRSAETESGASSPTGSARKSLPPQPRHLQQQPTSSPLNPSHRTHRQTASETRTHGRARTHSDATAAYATLGATDRRITMDGRVPRATRRRSEAPAEWLAEVAGGNARFSSVRSRSGPGTGRDVRRESVMSLGGGSVVGSPSMGAMGAMGSWGHSGFPASPSMIGGLPSMPMAGFAAASSGMGMGMGMMPNSSPSMMFNPAALQVPMPYFASPQMPFLPSMPMLAPPSPGFHSGASSGVPTPPESPHLSTTHLPKAYVPEIMFSPPSHAQQRQSPHV